MKLLPLKLSTTEACLSFSSPFLLFHWHFQSGPLRLAHLRFALTSGLAVLSASPCGILSLGLGHVSKLPLLKISTAQACLSSVDHFFAHSSGTSGLVISSYFFLRSPLRPSADGSLPNGQRFHLRDEIGCLQKPGKNNITSTQYRHFIERGRVRCLVFHARTRE